MAGLPANGNINVPGPEGRERTRFDVAFQRIQLVGIRQGVQRSSPPAPSSVFSSSASRSCRRAAVQTLRLDFAQLPVPAKHARSDPERVQRRYQPHQWNQHDQDRGERDPHPVDHGLRSQKRQVSLQQRAGRRGRCAQGLRRQRPNWCRFARGKTVRRRANQPVAPCIFLRGLHE